MFVMKGEEVHTKILTRNEEKRTTKRRQTNRVQLQSVEKYLDYYLNTESLFSWGPDVVASGYLPAQP